MNTNTEGATRYTDADRKAFEAFARGIDRRYDMESYGDGDGFGYVNQDVDFMWEGWQYALVYAREAKTDLLEAASLCMSLCEEVGMTETNAYAAARAAIAKATGSPA